MFLKTNTCLLLVLLCSLSLWCKSTSAGSSFLSPSQKPPNKAKTPRVGRQVPQGPAPPTDEHHITVSAPFDIGITMTAEEFEEYGAMLQDMVQRVLGNTEAAEGTS